MTYTILFAKQAEKDIAKLTPKLKEKLKDILTEVILKDPFSGKRLLGELGGNFSYKLNLKDRIVYSIDEKKKIVYIKRAKTHYGD